jgi:enoyl-CoA hydratase/carnithine racemase
VAATSLALCLREQSPSMERALIAESAVFSALQSGSEFAAWRMGRGDRRVADEAGPAVRLRRTNASLNIILNRPQSRNALNRAMRDAWLEALTLAEADPTLTEVVVLGEGSNFCGGGDLYEFGTFSDPAAAHLIRLIASIGRSMVRIGPRLRVEVHGPCAGSGVELAAFAPLVVAQPDFTATLPEVSMGLIPGAGGTVSITRRIGRHRMALLALSGGTITASTALAWGLIDRIIA